MRRTCLFLLALFISTMALAACSSNTAPLTDDQRQRRAEDLVENELSY